MKFQFIRNTSSIFDFIIFMPIFLLSEETNWYQKDWMQKIQEKLEYFNKDLEINRPSKFTY